MKNPRRDAWPAATPRLRNRPLRNLITEPRNQACGTNLPEGPGPLRNGPLRNLITEPRNQESGTKDPGEPGPLRKRESCEVGKAIFEVGNCFAAVQGRGSCAACGLCNKLQKWWGVVTVTRPCCNWFAV